MGFRTTVENHRGGRLTRADERLLKELLEAPADFAFSSAGELARRAGVHEATVVRLAQKLGYEGYPKLRRALQSELLDDLEPANRVRRRLAQAEDRSILLTLVSDEVSALEQLPNHVGQEQIDAVATNLISARRILLFGQGHATGLVNNLDRRLRRSGFSTITLTHQGRDLAERLVSLDSQDTILAFAFHKCPRGLVPVLETATDIGCPTILVSDMIGPLIRPQPNLVLAAPRGSEDEFRSLTVPMTICNAIVLTIANLDQGRSLASLERLSGLIDSFDNERRSPG